MQSYDYAIAANGSVPATSSSQSRAIMAPVPPGPAKENEAIAASGSEVVFRQSISPVPDAEEQKNNTHVSLGSGDDKGQKPGPSAAVAPGSSENPVLEKVGNYISEYSNGVRVPPPHTQSYPVAVRAYTDFSTDGAQGLARSEVSPISLLLSTMSDLGILAPAVPVPQPPMAPLTFPQPQMTPLTFPQPQMAPLTFPQPQMAPLTSPQPQTAPLTFPQPPVAPFCSGIPGWPNGAWSVPRPGSSVSTTPYPPQNSDTTMPNLPQNSLPTMSYPPQNSFAMPYPPQNSVAISGSSSLTLTLGKHPREANSQEEDKPEETFWVPKALRITDPDEAAKSSIWASLGIKPDERLFCKCFQSKNLKNGKAPESPQALQANPAVFSDPSDISGEDTRGFLHL